MSTRPAYTEYPVHESHDEATAAGCFSCGAQLDGNPEDAGYPPGGGQFRQRCTACDFFTSYDVRGGDGDDGAG